MNDGSSLAVKYCCYLACRYWVEREASAQDFSELSLVQLESQLNAILKTRRDEEKAYVASIIKLVRANKIPRRLVLTSFKYVRNKRSNTNYPFVYFVQVLRFQGIRERIAIPRFDFSIYSVTPRRAAATATSGS